MHRLFLYILINLTLLNLAYSQDAKRLFVLSETSADKMLEVEGETVRVKGFVETTNKNATGIHFLNFKGPDFQCVTFARYVRNFEKPPMDLYKEKWIEVTGEIQNYRGNPQIRLTDPTQVKILDQPAPVKQVATTTTPSQPKEEEEKPTSEKAIVEVEPVVEEPPKPNEPVVEVINGVPAIDWRQYFPSDQTK